LERNDKKGETDLEV